MVTGRNGTGAYMKLEKLSVCLQSMGLHFGSNDNDNVLMVFNHDDELYVGDKNTARQSMVKEAGWEEDNLSAARLPRGRKGGRNGGTTQHGLDTRYLIEWSVLETKWGEWLKENGSDLPGLSNDLEGDDFSLVQEILGTQEVSKVTVQHLE